MDKEDEIVDIFKVQLEFNSKGELVNVEAITGNKMVVGPHIPLNDMKKSRLNKFTNHAVLFGWGSPGCVYFYTKNGGYTRVCP